MWENRLGGFVASNTKGAQFSLFNGKLILSDAGLLCTEIKTGIPSEIQADADWIARSFGNSKHSIENRFLKYSKAFIECEMVWLSWVFPLFKNYEEWDAAPVPEGVLLIGVYFLSGDNGPT